MTVLDPLSPVMLLKIDIKKQKNATLNSHISKARTNLELRLIFFKITLFSALSTHLGIRHEDSAPTNPGSAARGS